MAAVPKVGVGTPQVPSHTASNEVWCTNSGEADLKSLTRSQTPTGTGQVTGVSEQLGGVSGVGVEG